MGTLQKEAVNKHVKYVGVARCDVCKGMRADCAEFMAGLFANGVICDTCCGIILRGFSGSRGGDGEVS